MSVTSTLKPSRCSRELVHVSTDLGDDRLGGHLVDAGNPVQERDECKKSPSALEWDDLGVETISAFLEHRDIVKSCG